MKALNKYFFAPRELVLIFISSSLILFFLSSLRHFLFHSSSFDLGIFDQAIYLISIGKEPVSSFIGFHILGDHAAWIHYLLAIPYIIYPDVHWLFLIQAIALTIGIFPIYFLAINAGLQANQAKAIVFVYLLYPAVFNANLFDFHPEVIAVPLIFFAILAARLNKLFYFCLCLILILGCKAVLSLTVASLGIWLLFFEKRRLYGLISLTLGIAWFLISTQLIIPGFSGGEAAAVGRYSYLGDSVFEIFSSLISQPQLIFKGLFSWDNLGYLVLLFLPVAWGISSVSLLPLVGAFPIISLNLLADHLAQKDLVHQYSLPILPFLILAVITSLAAGKGLIKKPKYMIIWSVILFLCLAKFTHFTTIYLTAIDNLKETYNAIALVQSDGGVYTTDPISSHLSHRQVIRFTNKNSPEEDLGQFEYILLNQQHPGWLSDLDFVNSLIARIAEEDKFAISYQKNGVLLFVKRK